MSHQVPTDDSRGARYYNVDLHVHTPASEDVHSDYKATSEYDIVDKASEAGLDIIAITDHNSVEWCQKVIDASANRSLHVLPGAEISTPEGHLLAIFDANHSIESIRQLLIRIGFVDDSYASVHALSQCGMDKVAPMVKEAGGLAIAAHVDATRGFWHALQETGQRRMQIYNTPEVEALEIVNTEWRDGFENGTRPGYQRCVACVQGSDSWLPAGDRHQLEGIGNRRTFLKLGEPTIRSIRHAFSDFRMRVALEGDPRPIPTQAIEGISVDGGFFDGALFPLNDGVSCLIGGTGTGKSLAIELVRFALADQVSPDDFPAIRREVDNRLSFALSSGATVSVTVRRDNSRYLIERAWQEGEPGTPVVYELDEEVRALPDIDVRSFFPITAYSQSEIIEYARQPLARLSLLDRLLADIGSLRHRQRELVDELRTNAEQLVSTERSIAECRDELQERPGLEEREGTLSGFFEEDAVRSEEKWRAEEAYVNAIQQMVTGLPDELKGKIDEGLSEARTSLPDVPLEGPNSGTMRFISEGVDGLFGTIRQSDSTFRQAVERTQSDLQPQVEQWYSQFQEHDESYRQMLSRFTEEGGGRSSLFQELQGIQERLRELDVVSRKLERELEPELRRLSSRREELLSELQGVRNTVRDQRREKSRQLTRKMSGDVRIRVEGWVQREDYRQKLLELRTGSYVREDQIEKFVEACHPIPLVKSLVAGNYQEVARHAGLEAGVVERFVSNIYESGRVLDLFDLQTLNVDDGVSIQFALEGGEYRSLEALAHGQKCTAVLMVALAEGVTPLIVDQPEDALHAPWIERYIVERVLSIRGRRQCLFSSRSPNVVVSSDSEQIIALSASANNGHVDKGGSLEEYETRELVLYHVEGGKEEFLRRRQKYGLVD